MRDHPHTIDRWDDATGESLIEEIAGVTDYEVAQAAYRAAAQRWPDAKITLHNRARIIPPLAAPSYLLGDCGGERTRLLERGVRFASDAPRL